MKIPLLIFLFCLILFSCGVKRNSYIAPMPVPMFEKGGEVKFNTAMSALHVEGQGAVSFLKHWAITGGVFLGTQNRKSYETGLHFFAPINQRKQAYFFGGIGWGNSSINLKTITSGYEEGFKYMVRVHYSTIYIHPGIYYIGNKKGKNMRRLSLSLKCSFNSLNDFLYLEEKLYRTAWYGRYTYESTKKSQVFRCITPVIGYEGQQGKFIFNIQIGCNYVSALNTQVYYTHRFAPKYNYDEKQKYYFGHQAFLLNTSIGLRL